jgi:ABC-type Mn2+/Zn2+ transport system ATPase subunit
MAETIVQIKDLAVLHQEGLVLHEVSLSVAPGEFVGVIGPNGAGKTTLLTVINGLRYPDHGTVRVLGTEPRPRTSHRLRRRIGYVAQVEPVDPRLPITVRETVMVGRYGRIGWLQRPCQADWDCVHKALDEVGVRHLARRPIGRLSGGEYQRVAIARALAQEPDLFLFDEPTASIDPQAQRDILDLIQRIHAEHRKTTLYITHDLDTLPAACDRLILMKNGTIWRQGPPKEMLRDSLLRTLYNSAPDERGRTGTS